MQITASRALGEEVVSLASHPTRAWHLIGTRSGKFALLSEQDGLGQVFSHSTQDLKAVLFCDAHTLRAGILRTSNSEDGDDALQPTSMVAICSRQVCLADTQSKTLVRISLEMSGGAPLTGAHVQLDVDHLLLGTSSGALVCFSLRERGVVRTNTNLPSTGPGTLGSGFVNAMNLVHDRPITSMVSISNNEIVVGSQGGGAFLSVWRVSKVHTAYKTGLDAGVLFSVVHRRNITLAAKPQEVCSLAFDSHNNLLLCRLAGSNNVMLVWEMPSGSGVERLLYRLNCAFALPLLAPAHSCFPAKSLLLLHEGSLVSALPQSVAKAMAAALENGILLPTSLASSVTTMAGAGTGNKALDGGGGEETLIPIRVLLRGAGSGTLQTRIVRFWQRLDGAIVYQSEDHVLRIAHARRKYAPCFAADFSIRRHGNELVRNTNQVLALIFPTAAEDFLRQKEWLMRCVAAENVSAVIADLWPGPPSLLLMNNAPSNLLALHWREIGRFAILQCDDSSGALETVFAGGECLALALYSQLDGSHFAAIVRRREEEEEESAVQDTPATAGDAAKSGGLRRGSLPMPPNPANLAFLKRLSLPNAAANAPPPTAAATPRKCVLAIHRLPVNARFAAPPSAIHEMELECEMDDVVHCGTGGLFILRSSTHSRFYRLVNGRLLACNFSALPRHSLVALSPPQQQQGVLLAMAFERELVGRIVILRLVDDAAVRYQCQVLLNESAETASQMVSMHWHLGTLFFTTSAGAVHVAFVGKSTCDALSWTLAKSGAANATAAAKSKRSLVHAKINPSDPRNPISLQIACGELVYIKGVHNQDLLLVDRFGVPMPQPVIKLDNALIKLGMLASAGFDQTALEWAQTLEDLELKNLAVTLLERLGFPKRACYVRGASPRLLLQVMLRHRLVEEAYVVFHPLQQHPHNSNALHALVRRSEQGDGQLSDGERLALLFSTGGGGDRALQGVRFVADAFMTEHDHNGVNFCMGLLQRLVVNQ